MQYHINCDLSVFFSDIKLDELHTLVDKKYEVDVQPFITNKINISLHCDFKSLKYKIYHSIRSLLKTGDCHDNVLDLPATTWDDETCLHDF